MPGSICQGQGFEETRAYPCYRGSYPPDSSLNSNLIRIPTTAFHNKTSFVLTATNFPYTPSQAPAALSKLPSYGAKPPCPRNSLPSRSRSSKTRARVRAALTTTTTRNKSHTSPGSAAAAATAEEEARSCPCTSRRGGGRGGAGHPTRFGARTMRRGADPRGLSCCGWEPSLLRDWSLGG